MRDRNEFFGSIAFIPAGRAIDWEAGQRQVSELPLGQLAEFHGFAVTEQEQYAVQQEVREAIERFKALIEVNEIAEYITPDKAYVLFIAGGMSDGDDPSEGFTVLKSLWGCSDVMAAMGFATWS